MDYKGYEKITLNQDQIAQFYSEGTLPVSLQNNEYALLYNEQDELFDKYWNNSGNLEKVIYKPFNNKWLGKVKPLNDIQELGFHMLSQTPSTLKVFNADYGVGKSFLCSAYMLDAIDHNKFDKIIMIRPNIGVEGYPSLGAVPGTYTQKSIGWCGMLGDIMGDLSAVEMLIAENKLEIAPIETMRGRSFQNSIILVEEAGNLTTKLCRLIVSRCGNGSQILMCGDEKQADRQTFRDDNGLKNMSEKLIGHPLFSYLRLEGCVRSKTAQLCELF